MLFVAKIELVGIVLTSMSQNELDTRNEPQLSSMLENIIVSYIF